MATEHTQRRDHAEDIRRIDAKATSDAWDERLSAIVLIQALLRDLPTERTVEHLLDTLDRLASDSKWEVRRAVIPVLLDTGHPSARRIIDRLINDANQWVREAARRAKRKIARITTPAEKRDKRSRFAFDMIKDFKAASPEKIYEVAILVGEKYYEEMAGDTAHELNTYQAAMDALLDELEHQVAGGKGVFRETEEILAKIRDRSRYLKTLVNGLLEYTRDTDLDFRLQPLKPIVAEALNLARDQTKARLHDSDITEKAAIPDDLSLEACRPRLVQALNNILSNAFHSFEGKKNGTVEIVAASSGEGQLCLSIRDTGRGMDPSQVENAKKRFRSLRKERGGIGLGLPLAIKIVEREHGGQLNIESESEVGTTVTIQLPLKREGRE